MEVASGQAGTRNAHKVQKSLTTFYWVKFVRVSQPKKP